MGPDDWKDHLWFYQVTDRVWISQEIWLYDSWTLLKISPVFKRVGTCATLQMAEVSAELT